MIRTRIIVPHRSTDAANATALAASVIGFDCECKLVVWSGVGKLAWPGFVADCFDNEWFDREKRRRSMLIVRGGFIASSDQLAFLENHEAQILHGDWGFYMKPLDVVKNFALIWFRWCMNGKVDDEKAKTSRKATVDESFAIVKEELKEELTLKKLTPAEAGFKKFET